MISGIFLHSVIFGHPGLSVRGSWLLACKVALDGAHASCGRRARLPCSCLHSNTLRVLRYPSMANRLFFPRNRP